MQVRQLDGTRAGAVARAGGDWLAQVVYTVLTFAYQHGKGSQDSGKSIRDVHIRRDVDEEILVYCWRYISYWVGL